MPMMKLKLMCLLLLALPCNTFAQEATTATRLKPVYVNGRWGHADQSGRVVLKAQFDAARPFVDGLAQVGVLDEELPELEARPNIEWGFIDRTGRFVIEPQFTGARPFAGGLAQVATAEGRRRLIDRSGKVIWLL
jgi:hypothetical protein